WATNGVISKETLLETELLRSQIQCILFHSVFLEILFILANVNVTFHVESYNEEVCHVMNN
uniref:hypothetical protein n=1 Tax=Bradyrhizobium sp. TM233 TaxID=2599801 RepID=UPI0030C6CD73